MARALTAVLTAASFGASLLDHMVVALVCSIGSLLALAAFLRGR